MRNPTVLALLGAALTLALGTSAQAGIFTSSPVTDLPPQNYQSSLGTPESPGATATVQVTLPTANTAYTIAGTTADDPPLHIIQGAINDTPFDWGAYAVTIIPTAGTSIVGDVTINRTSSFKGYPNIVTYLPTAVYDPVTATVTHSGGTVPSLQQASI